MGDLTLHFAFVPPSLSAELPARCCAVAMSPRLQHALLRLTAHAQPARGDELNARALLEEIRDAEVVPLPLPLEPRGRLEPLLTRLREQPGFDHRLPDCAAHLSMSPSTLTRTFQRELGMSFGQWLRLLRLQHGLERVALGDNVACAAQRAGYESVSMFVSAFRRALGTTPGRYARRQAS